LKILLISDAFLPSLGGIERHVYTLANYLSNKGHDITVLTEKMNVDEPVFKNKGIFVRRSMDLVRKDADYKWPYTRLYNSKKILEYTNLMGDEYDVVHYHGTHPLYLDYRKMNSPLISTIHAIFPVCIANWGVNEWCGKDPSSIGCVLCTIRIKKKYVPASAAFMIYSKYYYHRMKVSLNSLDKVISVSDYVRNIVKKGLNLTNLITIYNFIDIRNDIMLNLKKSKLKISNLGIEAHSKIILFSGRLVEAKGIHVLIKSFKKIQEKYDDVYLIITGGGKLQDYVKKMSENDEKIKYRGYISRENQLKILNEASVFVAPSTYPDACPTSILEAMALGVPVVSTKIGGIPELIIEGKTGLLAKPNDINELSFKIAEILSRKQNVYREDCIKQAERFDITNVGAQITDLYLALNRK
jgi:glycosyltransferase involved in cell wall biosynthesis